MYNKENTKEAEEIFQRINTEMIRQGRKQVDLIKYLDLPHCTYTNWKLNKSRNFCEHLGEISSFLGVSVQYLVTGYATDEGIQSAKEHELLKWYHKLPPEKQDAVLQNVRWLAE